MEAKNYEANFRSQIKTQVQNVLKNGTGKDKARPSSEGTEKAKQSSEGTEKARPSGAGTEKVKLSSATSPAADDRLWYLRQGGYRCPLCQSLLSSRGNLKTHIQHVHHLTPEAFAVRHGELPQAEDQFVCKVCDLSYPWVPRNIKRHLENTHFLSMDKYGEIYLRQSPSPPKAVAKKKAETGSGLTPCQVSCLKPVRVSVEKLRCDLSTVFSSGPALVSAAPVTAAPVPDYSSLSKNELGRCLNSAIENIFMDLAGGKERSAAAGSVRSADEPQWVEEEDLLPGRLFPAEKKCPSCLYTTHHRTDLAR